MRTAPITPSLFPETAPFNTHMMKVDDGPCGHRLYVEQSGNPDGLPVLFLHGGPGAGISPIHRRLFDPEIYHAVLFDQRGAGQSQPYAEIRDNTTWDLIADIEHIRSRLGIDKWLVFGGSWGSTLGLVYGLSHPQRCLGFILRGIFLGTKPEIDWFLEEMGRFYPEAWSRFKRFLPEAERHDLLAGYAARLNNPSPSIAVPAAESWAAYENSCATLRAQLRGGGGRMAMSLARLEAHYFTHQCFLEDGYILNGLNHLAQHPAVIIQGRHDVICPPHHAQQLAQAWPAAELVMVEDAGHSAFEPGILQALLSALNRMAASADTLL